MARGGNATGGRPILAYLFHGWLYREGTVPLSMRKGWGVRYDQDIRRAWTAHLPPIQALRNLYEVGVYFVTYDERPNAELVEWAERRGQVLFPLVPTPRSTQFGTVSLALDDDRLPESDIYIITRTDILYTQAFARTLAAVGRLHAHPEVVTLIDQDCEGYPSDVWIAFPGSLRARLRRFFKSHTRCAHSINRLFRVQYLDTGHCHKIYAPNALYLLPANNTWMLGRPLVS
mmetsp:Transcript_47254/g.100852  ORF Transcript_47254/g.100852 Transcript_47254/m.100852 type:complete len:231 (-) Transcript_47254:57-749(-)